MKALRILLSSVRTALNYPRVFLTAWAVVTVVAAWLVYAVLFELDEALGSHPGASYHLDQALDADLARLAGATEVPLAGGAVLVMLFFAFLAGGILTGVGTGRRFTYTGFLADCARLFLRNLRVLVLGVAVSALLFWGVGHLDRLIRADWVYDWDTGPISLFGWKTRWLSLEMGLEALSWLWGLLFLGVVFVSKMAMARLAAHDRRSALMAWLRSAGTVLRHPLRFTCVIALWALLWVTVLYGVGWLTRFFLEEQRDLASGLLFGELGVLWTQVLLVAAFVAARQLAVPAAATTDPKESDPTGGFAGS